MSLSEAMLSAEQSITGEVWIADQSVEIETMMSIEDVQRVLHRSRATIYRYANTDPKGKRLNLPYNPRYLNPEHRSSFRDPLQFHPTEVARYAKDVLHLNDVSIVVDPPSETDALLRAILEELREIRELLGNRS